MKLLTMRQVAERLGIARTTVHKIARRSKIGQRAGSFWLFTLEDLPKIKGDIRQAGNPNFKKKGKKASR